MWTKSFVATTVALGGSVDDAASSLAELTEPGAVTLVRDLGAAQRAARATALAKALRDIVVALDEVTLQ